MMSDCDTVQVAVRIRPLVKTEIEKGCRSCLDTIPNEPQVTVTSSGQSYTYNFVYNEHDDQSTVYDSTVQKLVQNLFKGYNVTILAYGQTGSGKTYSMGTNYTTGSDMGIIPRSVVDIFSHVEADDEWEFKITASFIELYKEHLFDLLSSKPREQCNLDIREDANRGIYMPGLIERHVCSADDTLRCLQEGSLGRATGATAMNAQSSRSHAIFTITIYQQRKNNVSEAMSAKFHLVDLAGSERSKKTKATGERFKEGVNINKGLLALGNVISALGEGTHSFISYRDSKLTRLLQDSLGGNSMTLMIACVSPADYNQEETMSTLRYADRARRIKNKPVVNQDPKLLEITRLRKENQDLRLELLGHTTGTSCPPEHARLVEDVCRMQEKNKTLAEALDDALKQSTHLCERALIAETSRDKMRNKLKDLQADYSQTLETVSHTILDKSKMVLLREISHKIIELQDEHQRSEEEILCHERSSNEVPEIGSRKDTNLEGESNLVDDVLREEHVLHQAQLNKELQELTKQLAWKEELVSKLAASSTHISEMRYDCENNAEEMKSQIAALQKEKDDLLQALKNVQNNVGSKLAEQRRKRLQELEQKIASLNKKVLEQDRILKMKEKSDEKINVLNNEIRNMKVTKVRLIKQMRFDHDKYRTWKQEREKEMVKLIAADRKRQNQIVRMEQMHNKQQNVWKRKVEEAAAVNKRLKDALAVQKSAQERRGVAGRPDKLGAWVAQELEVLVSTADAEHTLQQLIKDRATLSKQRATIKHKVEKEGAKLNNEEVVQLNKEMAQLADDLELRSAQIVDLQQKILDSDQENKANTRWETVQSMVEAKFALKHLFEVVADAKKDTVRKDYTIKDLKDIHDEALLKIDSYEKHISEMASAHNKEICEIEKEYEDKVLLLLRQLNAKGSTSLDSGLSERLKIQEEELEKMDSLREELEAVTQSNQHLQQQLAESKLVKQAKENKKLSKITEDSNANSTYQLTPLAPDVTESDDEDDVENDPDWQKTPLYKRLQSLKAPRCEGGQRGGGVKRDSDGQPRCNCKSNCAKRICSCRKAGNACSNACRCNKAVCVNLAKTHVNLDCKTLFLEDEEDTNSDNDSTEIFKRPRS